ncbi:MAG TPA: hypothetical protein VGK17_01440 [Propionicimonas sp.]
MSAERQVWISRPAVRMVEVIEVRFLRGSGVDESDPVREVLCLYDRDGTLIAERDSSKPLPNRERVS